MNQPPAWLVTLIVGFFIGVAVNLTSYRFLNPDAPIRLMERETKRLAFWKTLFETQAGLPEQLKHSSALHDRLVHAFQAHHQKAMDVAFGGRQKAQWFASMMVMLLSLWLWPTVILPMMNAAAYGGSQVPPSWGITGEFWTAIKISIPQVLVIVVWWKLMSEVLWQPLSNWAISKIRQGVWWTEAIPYVPVLLVICYSFFAR